MQSSGIEFDVKPWKCPKCTYKNKRSYYMCSMCSKEINKFSFTYPEAVRARKMKWDSEMTKMERLKKVFGRSHVLLPVIHCETVEQTLYNCDMCFRNKICGVWLICHSAKYPELIRIIGKVREKYPSGKYWIGANFLDLYPQKIHKILSDNEVELDGIWIDNSYINDEEEFQNIPELMRMTRFKFGWKGLYFGGTAFKYQSQPKNLAKCVTLAKDYMDVVCTSGSGTGRAMSVEKAVVFEKYCKGVPVAVASGLSVGNAALFSQYVNCFMTATSILRQGDFHNFDEQKLRQLNKLIESFNVAEKEETE